MKIVLFLSLQSLTGVWTLVHNWSEVTATYTIKTYFPHSSVAVVLTFCHVASFKTTPHEVSLCILCVCHMTKPL